MTINMKNQSKIQFSGQTNFYQGKVRDVYTLDSGHIVMVASNRLSAFDVVLPKPIPFKGQVLTQLATYFLRETATVAENWLIDTPHPCVSVGYACTPYPLEIVVRNCLVGHAWRTYKSGERRLCGVTLPDGMKEYDRFDPIITPATKATSGHDEDISYEEILERKLVSKSELDIMYATALRLFAKGQEMANERGLFLADTKYEFGERNGKILVIDEIHTPDSSRYFDLDSYEAFISGNSDSEPKHLSKEFVREWLMEQGFSGQEGQKIPDLTDDFIESISERYIDLYEKITSRTFIKSSVTNEKDIETVVSEAIRNL